MTTPRFTLAVPNHLPRDGLLEEISSIYLKHTDALLPIFETWWKLSKNPVFAWEALAIATHPQRLSISLPQWLNSYLNQAAASVCASISTLRPSESKDVLLHAIGLTEPQRSIIDDARMLWDSPVIYGFFEEQRSIATVRARSEFAYAATQKAWKTEIGSIEVAKERVKEAKDTVKAFLTIRGIEPSDAEVSLNCKQALQYQVEVVDVLADLYPTEIEANELRATFASAPNRRAAIRAALRRPFMR